MLKKDSFLARDSFLKLPLIIFALIFAGVGGYILLNSKAAGVEANLFVVAAGGSPSCVRSATLVDFTSASANNNVCGPGTGALGYNTNGWNNACRAASNVTVNGGTLIAVKAATYSPNSDGSLIKDTDCSGGRGADVNPNAVEQGTTTGTTANWATYICADSPCGINFTAGSIALFYANFHVKFQGISFNTTLRVGQGGASASQRVQNVQVVGNSTTDRINMFGLELLGARNILFKYVNYGPSVFCGKNDPNVPANFRCSPTGPAFESQLANAGIASPGCSPNNSSICGGIFTGGEFVEVYVHQGDSSNYQNVRLHDFIDHDSNTKQSGSGVHPGCFFTFDSGNGPQPEGNFVIDHGVCERITAAGVQLADSGTIIQNSVFSCVTLPLDQSAGRWDSCTNFPMVGVACKLPGGGCTVSNVLIRYNTFISAGGASSLNFPTQAEQPGTVYGSVSNIRVVGNVFGGFTDCSTAGVTYSNNAFLSGVPTCGSGAVSLAPGDPWIQSSITTPGGLWSMSSLLNARGDGSPVLPTVANTGSDVGDLNLSRDADGNLRPNPSTMGAYQYSPGGSDTTPPTVSLTAPAAGATVSGAAVTLSATAADNVGVAGVQFKLDGTNIGSEDTTSPYSISWNSTSTSNGSHNLSATARDAAGNATTSAAINVTVSNGVTPPPPPPSPPVVQTPPTATSQFGYQVGIHITIDPGSWTGSPTFAYQWQRCSASGLNCLNVTDVDATAQQRSAITADACSTLRGVVTATNAGGSATANTAVTPVIQPATGSCSPPVTKPGDLNNDNAVNIFDLSILLSNYNTTNAVADINKDGTVNVQDLSILLSNYGT